MNSNARRAGLVRGGHHARQRGMVTAELAVGVMVMALALLFASAVVGLLIQQDAAENIAAQVARHAARGDDAEVAKVKRRAPKGATVGLDEGDGWVRATVTIKQRWGRVGPVTLTATAQAAKEPGQ